MREAVTQENKIIAKTLATAFGVKPTVRKYWDDNRELSVDVLTCANPVDPAWVNYGTIGLSDHPLMQDGKEFPVRVEITGAAYEQFVDFPNILSTAAFYTMRNNWFCSPGAVLRNGVEMYLSNSDMKHLLFTAPSLWEDNLTTLPLDTKKVAWLMAVPISEAERVYKEANGTEALEDLLEKHQVDVLDLKRKSVV
ncbi:suppressor of fused domain protein [Hymenobacter weizhouensis]|uniref:suppressor of fused domain protein n=1 Tax=Hymenobacter sp. YIM 151500-1 TaxID=2987689 RepID=UPI002226EB85|nr:suppressor of fused domain protein [Hymenobacter sp. YIM 151500-1]UYZ64890.1 suppressor of fused domain protein [Hymenobacter sp. YIM 151500-1]